VNAFSRFGFLKQLNFAFFEIGIILVFKLYRCKKSNQALFRKAQFDCLSKKTKLEKKIYKAKTIFCKTKSQIELFEIAFFIDKVLKLEKNLFEKNSQTELSCCIESFLIHTYNLSQNIEKPGKHKKS
jgi:hypothetical protein